MSDAPVSWLRGKDRELLKFEMCSVLRWFLRAVPWHREVLPRADTAETNTRVTQYSSHSSPCVLFPPGSSQVVSRKGEKGWHWEPASHHQDSCCDHPFPTPWRVPGKGRSQQGHSQTRQDNCRVTHHPWMQMGRQCFNFSPDPSSLPQC